MTGETSDHRKISIQSQQDRVAKRIKSRQTLASRIHNDDFPSFDFERIWWRSFQICERFHSTNFRFCFYLSLNELFVYFTSKKINMVIWFGEKNRQLTSCSHYLDVYSMHMTWIYQYRPEWLSCENITFFIILFFSVTGYPGWKVQRNN